MITLDDGIRPPQWGWVWATVGLIFLAAGVVVAGWDRLPDPLPMHFDAAGNPDATGPKTWPRALLLATLTPLIMALTSAMSVGLLHAQAKHAGSGRPTPAPEDVARKRAEANWMGPVLSRWLFVLAAGIGGGVIAAMFGARFNLLWLLVFIVAACAWFIWDVVRFTRALDSEIPRPEGSKDKRGPFYVDRDDARIAAFNSGGNLGINLGRPGGWALLAGLLAPMIVACAAWILG